jgi:hypothetical protein
MSSPGQNGMAAFVLSIVLLSFLLGPPRCNDGWHSPSIGKQGACSWHGGVNNTPQFLSFLASVFVGFVVYALSHWRELKRQEELQAILYRDEPVPIDNEAHEKLEKLRESVIKRIRAVKAEISYEGITCPLCGSAMEKRLARRGPWKGKYFLGCSQYPRCRGIRNIG